MPKLTQKTTDITKVPSTGQIILRDDDLKGFGLRASIILLEVLEEYLAARTLKSSTVEIYRRVIKKSLREWLHLPITQITKNMVEDRHRQLACGTKHGHPGRAYSNFCFKTLQTLLNYAAEKYEINGEPIITVNPVSRLTKTRAWFRVPPRTGVIPAYELASRKTCFNCDTKKLAAALITVLQAMRQQEARCRRCVLFSILRRTILDTRKLR